MMPVTLNRSVCCDLNETISREWLITNGLDAYAAGTVAGVLTRMEHGLLVACPPESDTPQLLLAKIDEEVVFDQRTYYLGTNEYRDGTLNPSGFVHLETFRLEEGFPVFTYRFGGIDGIVLEKRIWMQQGRDTTYIQYRLVRTTQADETGYRRSGITGALSNGPSRSTDYNEAAQQAITLTLLPFTAYRPYNQAQHGNNDWHFQVRHYQAHAEGMLAGDELRDPLLLPEGVAGCTIRAWENAHPYHLFAVGQPESAVSFIPTNVWYWNFLRRQDAAAGWPALDDLYLPGVIRATLWPDGDATLTIIVSAEELATLILHPQQLSHSYTRSIEGQRQLFSGALIQHRYFGDGGEAARAQRLSVLHLSATSSTLLTEDEAFLRSLLRANERFLIQHRLPHISTQGDHERLFGRPESVPALCSNFFGMERLTRDTLIALPGLMVATGRYNEISRILRDLAQSFKQGMLPDIVPLPGSQADEQTYHGADTPLWFCYALDSYLQNRQDYELLNELYPRIAESVNWYIRGNEYGVKMDPNDGLLSLSGDACTWMNARKHGVALTPRQGKPVEVNALWYNALSLLREWSQRLARSNRFSREQAPYQELLALCKANFHQKFWYSEGSYLFDVVAGLRGDDAALRPNQLLACSLRYAVLDDEQHRTAILDKVTKSLLTPYGLRTLAPGSNGYRGSLGLSIDEQLEALHQGSVWTWLLGPYIDALYKTAYTSAAHNETLWKRSLQQLLPFQKHLNEGMLDMIGGIFDGNAPHTGGYVPASVLGSAELVRVYHTLTQIYVRQPHLVQSR